MHGAGLEPAPGSFGGCCAIHCATRASNSLCRKILDTKVSYCCLPCIPTALLRPCSCKMSLPGLPSLVLPVFSFLFYAVLQAFRSFQNLPCSFLNMNVFGLLLFGTLCQPMCHCRMLLQCQSKFDVYCTFHQPPSCAVCLFSSPSGELTSTQLPG